MSDFDFEPMEMMDWDELAQEHPQEGTTYIYFIESQDGDEFNKIKIGRSKQPVKRLRTLQTGSTSRLELLATFWGTEADEIALHQRFAQDRVWSNQEYFHSTPELRQLIQEVLDGEYPKKTKNCAN